jgi:hypothetical protein
MAFNMSTVYNLFLDLLEVELEPDSSFVKWTHSRLMEKSIEIYPGEVTGTSDLEVN